MLCIYILNYGQNNIKIDFFNVYLYLYSEFCRFVARRLKPVINILQSIYLHLIRDVIYGVIFHVFLIVCRNMQTVETYFCKEVKVIKSGTRVQRISIKRSNNY